MVLAFCPLLLLAFSAVEWLLPPRAAQLVPEERFSNESWTTTARRLQGQVGGGFPQPSSSGVGEFPQPSGSFSGESSLGSGFPSSSSGGFPSGSSSGGGEANIEALIAFVFAYMLFILTIICGTTIGRIVFAVQYQNKVTNMRPMWPVEGSQAYQTRNEFSFPLCGCLDDMQYCLHGFCCHECRVADTMQATHIQQFWPMILILYAIGFGIRLISGILQTILQTVFGAILGGGAATEHGKAQPVSGLASGLAFPVMFLATMIPVLLTGAAMAYFRGRLRERLSGGAEVPFADLNRFFQDTLIWGFCGPCAVIQEAREVDTATGLRVDCCCELKGGFGPMGAMQQPAVGWPVHVQGGMQRGMQSGNQQAFQQQQQQQQQSFSGLRY